MKYFTFILFQSIIITTVAQTARVQFIHNSPDITAQVIDIYINDSLLIDDFTFHTATAYLEVTSESVLSIGIAPFNSTSVSNVVISFEFTLATDVSYIMVASGMIAGLGFEPAIPFTLDLIENAREIGTEGTATDILFYHGSTDAPDIDVLENDLLLLTAIDNLHYGDIIDYISMPTADYSLNIMDESQTISIGQFDLPLSGFGLGYDAVTIVSSGFVSPVQNMNGPDFGLWMAVAQGGALIPLPTEKSRLQIIHNSADQTVALVDVYTNGFLFANDFAFRTCTPFLDMPSGIEIDFVIAPSNSTSAEDAIVSIENITFSADEKYILVANGIVSETGYSPAPALSFNMLTNAREEAENMAEINALVMHGSTDAPIFDVEENQFLNLTVIDNIGYGSFSNYIAFPAVDATFDITDETGEEIFASYLAPFQALALEGAAVTVLASGFLNAENNSNGPPIGLWMALAAGGDLIPLEEIIIPPVHARAQIIHNSADEAALVDVYLDDLLPLNDFQFRTATPFIDLPAASNISLQFAPSNSSNANDAFASFDFNLTENETYIMIVSGIQSATGYNPAPSFSVNVFQPGQEASMIASNTDILFYNGSTDSPNIDVNELTLPQNELINNLSYGNFEGYIALAANSNYGFEMQDGTGTVTLATYSAPLATLNLEGNAITLFASGFLNPINNSNGAAYEIWVALADGSTFELPNYVGVDEMNSNADISLFPNPAQDALYLKGTFAKNILNVEILDELGRRIQTFSKVKKDDNFNSVVDISKLENGTYCLRIFSENNIETKKFVVFR